MIEDLLNKIPDGILGGDKKGEMQNIQDNANNSQMQNTQVSPRDPEEFTQYVQNIFKQIMPAIEFHDELYVPERYLLPFSAVLRSISNKLLG